MNTGVVKRALGLVLIYIGVFVAIVLIQFARSPGFLARSGALSVSASYPSTDRKGPPSSVKIQYAGIIFDLSAASPAQVKNADGSTAKALPQSVEKIPGGARIVLDKGIELRAVVDQDALPTFRLSAVQNGSGASTLTLPWRLSRGARMTANPDQLVLDTAGGSFAFFFRSSAVDRGAGTLAFQVGDDPTGVAVALKKMAPPVAAAATPATPTTPTTPAKVLVQSPMDPAAYKAILDGWEAKAWLGFGAGRWDSDRLGWKDASGGNAAFSEKTLVAYLAEAASRGSLPDALARMKQAVSRNAASLTFVSTPFLGDTIARMETREGDDLQEVKRLSGLVQAKDTSILEKYRLIHFLMDRSPYVAAQIALRFIAVLDPAKLTMAQVVGYLDCAVESRVYLTAAENPFQAGDAAAARLVGALAKSQEGWFLKTEDDGSSNLRLSLEAGLDLVAYGNAVGKDVLVGVGQSLVASALGLADQNGFLPARLAPKADGPSDRSGSLAPEDIYALAIANPYFPHEQSFYRELGPGVWVWTCSPSMAVSASSSSCVFTVSFPTGISHYMAIYGLKPFSTIKLYGINYSPDAAFESYDVSGYLYRKASNALYLKMKHKQDAEKIELYY